MNLIEFAKENKLRIFKTYRNDFKVNKETDIYRILAKHIYQNSVNVFRIEDKIKHGTPDIIATNYSHYLFIECKINVLSKCQQFQLRHLIEENYKACFVFHDAGQLVIVFNALLSRLKDAPIASWASLFNISIYEYELIAV